MTTNSAELKPLPCPFCGAEPSVVSWGKDKRTGAPFHQIECCECGCSLGYSSDPLKKHIERWNGRRTAAQGEQAGSAEQVSEQAATKLSEINELVAKFPLQEAALSAPERKVTDTELPPLPTPEHDLWTKPGFTANQMREYALAALNQQGEQTAPEGWNAAIEAAANVAEAWPLIPDNMNKAERYAKHGWGNAVSGVLRADVATEIRRLKAAPSTAQKEGGNNG